MRRKIYLYVSMALVTLALLGLALLSCANGTNAPQGAQDALQDAENVTQAQDTEDAQNAPQDAQETHTAGELYPLTARIVSIDRDGDNVLIATASGVTYAFYGVEDYDVNDYVSIIMNDNGTPSIYDDIIVSVRYSGFTYNNY